MPLVTPPIKNIKEVTEPLKEQILKGDVHTIDEMRAWLKPLGYSDTINEAAINFILREFVMSKVSSDSMMNMDMVVDLLRPQLEVTTKDIGPVIIMELYHHRDLIGSPSAYKSEFSHNTLKYVQTQYIYVYFTFLKISY